MRLCTIGQTCLCVNQLFLFFQLQNEIVFLHFLKQEEEETTEFYLSLEKDLQQEDYLQGRMQGNPYSSKEPGLGPLMRDVKNKICIGKYYLIYLLQC